MNRNTTTPAAFYFTTYRAREAQVKFAKAEPDAVYSVTVAPYRETQTWIREKTAAGFTVAFSDPPTQAARIDRQLIRWRNR
jgi:hypothetical protein